MNRYLTSDFKFYSKGPGDQSYRTSGLKTSTDWGRDLRLTEAEVRFLPDGSIQLTVIVWHHPKLWYSKGYHKISHTVLIDGKIVQLETYNGITCLDWHGSPIPYLALKEFCEQNQIPFQKVYRNFRKTFGKCSYGLSMDNPKLKDNMIRNPDFEEHHIKILSVLDKVKKMI